MKIRLRKKTQKILNILAGVYFSGRAVAYATNFLAMRLTFQRDIVIKTRIDVNQIIFITIVLFYARAFGARITSVSLMNTWTMLNY